MRENRREKGKFMEDERKIVGGTTNLNIFQNIHINRGRERIIQPLNGCVSSRGATFLGEILFVLKRCLEDLLVKMMVPCEGF